MDGSPPGDQSHPHSNRHKKGVGMTILDLQKFDDVEHEALDLGSTISNGC